MTNATKMVKPESKRTKPSVEELLKLYNPSGISITPDIVVDAGKVIKESNKIFCRYIRSPHKTIMVKEDEDTATKYQLVNGKPVAIMVAFMFEDNLYIGWAKRNPLKTTQSVEYKEMIEHVAKAIVKEINVGVTNKSLNLLAANALRLATPGKEMEISFNKKIAKRMAVIRALSDEINIYPKYALPDMPNKYVENGSGNFLPKVVAKNISEFIADATNVFGGNEPINVTIHMPGNEMTQKAGKE